MILTIAKNYGGTDQYRRVLGINGMTVLTLSIPTRSKIIPEEEIWRVFKWVYNNDLERYEHLVLCARDSNNMPILAWEEKFPIDRVLAALQACRARIHLEFQ